MRASIYNGPGLVDPAYTRIRPYARLAIHGTTIHVVAVVAAVSWDADRAMAMRRQIQAGWESH